MEHIADTLKKDPLEVREANYLKPGDDLIPAHGVQEAGSKFEGENLAPVLVDEIKKNANYEARKKEVEDFNKVCVRVIKFEKNHKQVQMQISETLIIAEQPLEKARTSNGSHEISSGFPWNEVHLLCCNSS